MSNRIDLYKSALKDPRVKALLDTISYAEGTSGPEGYRTMFTGKKFDTSQGWRHPDTVMRGGDTLARLRTLSNAYPNLSNGGEGDRHFWFFPV